jgi:hypothetical protein
MQKTDLSAFLAFQRNLKSGLKHFIFLEFLCLLSFFKKRKWVAEGKERVDFNFKPSELIPDLV